MLVRTAASYMMHDFWKIAIWGVGGDVSFLQKRILYSWPQKSLLWIRKLSSNYLHSIQVDMRNSLWDINKYMTKSCPSWKSGKTSYSGIGQKLGRPVIHTHHIYMYEHIFFGKLKAQIIRLCNVEMKIWGCTPSSGAFSNWLSRRKCRKTKNKNFRISNSSYHRYTQFTSRYMFLGMTNTVILVKKILYTTKKETSKSKKVANFGQQIVLGMKSTNMPVSILP